MSNFPAVSKNGHTTKEAFVEKEKCPIQAMQSNIIIKPCEAESISKGGIIIADSVKERPNKGWVVSLGEDLKDKPIKIGTLVYHVKGAGTEVEIDEVQHFIMRYTDCLCFETETGKITE